jgi:hypothetical protein
MLDRDASLHPGSLSASTTVVGSEIIDFQYEYDLDDGAKDVLKSKRCFWCIIM